MKTIDPSEIRVVKAGAMLFLYRDRTLVEEADSLQRPTGILHACGLFRSDGGAEWIPGYFYFRKDAATPTKMTCDSEPFEWIAAGVILGERTARYRKTNSAIYVDPGRLQDQSISARIWRDWLQWRNQGSPGTFARFTLRNTKLRFGEDERIHKIVQRLGLSVS